MMPGADTDPVLVEDGRDVVRVNVAVRERDHARPVVARAVHRDALDLREPLDRGSRKRLLVLGDPLEADALEVADRRPQADRSFHVRRAGLELWGNLVVRRMIEAGKANVEGAVGLGAALDRKRRRLNSNSTLMS